MRLFEILTPEILEKELQGLIAATHSLGWADGFVIPGGSSVSAKVESTDLFGHRDTLLFVSGQAAQLSAIGISSFAAFHNQRLVDLVGVQGLDEKSLQFEVRASRITSADPLTSADILLHAVVPQPFVFFTQPDAILAVASTPDGTERMQALFGDAVRILPYAAAGPALARAVKDALSPSAGQPVSALFVMQQGLITFGATASDCLKSLMHFYGLAQGYLDGQGAWKLPASASGAKGKVLRKELASLRKALSDALGQPVVLRTVTGSDAADLVELSRSMEFTPLIPSHLPGYQYLPLQGRDIARYLESFPQGLISKSLDGSELPWDKAPRIILDSELGLCSAGRTADECAANAEYLFRVANVVRRSTQLGQVSRLPMDAFADAQRMDALLVRPESAGSEPNFNGEVALVTGAASGIGKACARSFLDRGAAVVGLDISPSIEGLFPGRAFLGVVCDVSDEKAICSAVDRTALAFGGLDMLVLNAGIFPAGCRIDAMDMDEWQKVIAINLNGSMALMRETFALLKLAPRHGRVVINGSRNVKAPGPGASAYSASKAALTQLARVAALEWGKDGIRVNVVHPNAVFDTALYTEEVLKARAASYGITVEQYKKNNILQVEITSHDVGEMVAEMCGPLFAKVTGVQLSIDGGSDRVI